MKRLYFMVSILIGCNLFLISCSNKTITTQEITTTPAATPEPLVVIDDKKIINLDFIEFFDKDNTYPENLYQVKQTDMRKIYKVYNYDECEFMVYDGTDDNLHIGYGKDDNYYSICQIDNWDGAIDRETFEQSKSSIRFDTYENVLGTSGIHLSFWSGAAASNEFYFYTDKKSKSPELLISYCTGGFSEADIDLDGENELISYGGGLPTNFFLIIKRDGKIMKTDYLYYNGKPIFYDEIIKKFYIIDESNSNIYFEFNKEDGILLEK